MKARKIMTVLRPDVHETFEVHVWEHADGRYSTKLYDNEAEMYYSATRFFDTKEGAAEHAKNGQ